MNMIKQCIAITLILMSFYSSAQNAVEKLVINKTLDLFHQAASVADAKQYLGLLTEDAIFLGTDASERWSKSQFSDFVLPRFQQGKGWLYEVNQRNVNLLAGNSTAFFDEVLINKNYGRCRGSGVLVKTSNGWKISQYSLSVLVPNGISNQVIEIIKMHEQQ